MRGERMEFYNKSDLSKISILQFSKQIENSKSIDINQMVENNLDFRLSALVSKPQNIVSTGNSDQ
jgi:hypothetical protein